MGAENLFPHNPRRMYDSYNWQQQILSRGMASAIENPLRDAASSFVPLMYKPLFRRETAHNQFLHFPDNNDESTSPSLGTPLPDNMTRSDESMVANNFAT